MKNTWGTADCISSVDVRCAAAFGDCAHQALPTFDIRYFLFLGEIQNFSAASDYREMQTQHRGRGMILIVGLQQL